MATDLNPADYTVALFAPLPIEAVAMGHMLDKLHEGYLPVERGDDYVYTAGEINGHNVIIATFPSGHAYGEVSAAALAGQVKNSFRNLWFGLLVGVAAGLPNHSLDPPRDIRLGDVLVGKGSDGDAGIVTYGPGKETATGFEIVRRQSKTENVISSAIGKIRNLSHIRGYTFLRHYEEMRDKEHDDGTFIDPGPSKDDLYEASTTGEDVRPVLIKRIPRDVSKRTRVWYGLIGSGDKLVKNSQKRDELRDQFDLIGLEMEAAGTMASVPVGVIRGVCDYGDEQKNKSWQPYAAALAAAYAKEILYQIRPAAKSSRRQQNSEEDSLAKILETLKEDCLHSLSFKEFDSRANTIKPALQGTCNWVFELEKYQQWRNRDGLSNHNGVLWIKGKPGSGKSTLMKHILNHCQSIFQTRIIAAYFFNARGSKLEKTPIGMLRSLIFQLIDQDIDICDRFMLLFEDKRRKHGRDWEWEECELKDFLLNEASRYQTTAVLFLVDALDECDEQEVRQVVRFLESVSIKAADFGRFVSICLSSRHYPTIDMRKKIQIDVEKQREHDQDISKYVQEELRISHVAIEREVVEKAAHVFMWVVLVVGILNKAYDEGKTRGMEKKLSEVPEDLDALFLDLLVTNNQEKPTTLLMIQLVLFAEEVLKPEELYFAVLAGIDPEDLVVWDKVHETPVIIERFITSTSKGLVELRKYRHQENVQFIHESVSDFLLRNNRIQELDHKLGQNIVGQSHSRIVDCCMAHIMTQETAAFLTEQTDNDDFGSDQADDGEDEMLYIFEPYPFLKYASRNILYHAEIAQREIKNQHGLIKRLVRQNELWERLKAVHNNSLMRVNYEPFDAGLLDTLIKCGHLELFKCALLQSEVDPNIQGEKYGNALQAAAFDGYKSIVELLLRNGVDVNIQGGEYGTALQAAASGGYENVVELLLSNGADINIQGGEYGTALQAAANGGYENIVELLLSHRADVNIQGGRYGTALNAVTRRAGMSKQYQSIMDLLLDNGADIDVDGKYFTALQSAVYADNESKAKFLLDQGADVNAEGIHGTALQSAVIKGNGSMVKLLLDNGSNVKLRGRTYNTALQVAKQTGHQEIIELLVNHKRPMETTAQCHAPYPSKILKEKDVA